VKEWQDAAKKFKEAAKENAEKAEAAAAKALEKLRGLFEKETRCKRKRA
jgi:hypothetical protein